VSGRLESTPPWLRSDSALAQFGKQRETARQKYTEFTREGQHSPPIRTQLKHQIFSGDDAFND